MPHLRELFAEPVISDGLRGDVLLDGFLRKSWDESLHPRDHGKFSSTPGTSVGASPSPSTPVDTPATPSGNGTPSSSAASDDHPADARAKSLLSRLAEVPRAVRDKVTAFVEDKYADMVTRYGETGAKAVLGATILLLPVPFPGTSFIPVALAEAVLKLRNAVRGKNGDGTAPKDGPEMKALPPGEPAPELTPEEVDAAALALLRELFAVLGEEMPEVAQPAADPSPVDTPRIVKAWNPHDHPRDDDGKFIDANHMHEAMTDPKAAAELRAKVTKPEERAKLDAAIGAEKGEGETARDKEIAASPFLSALHRVANGEATDEDLASMNGYEENPTTSRGQREAIRRAKKMGGYHGRTDAEFNRAKKIAQSPFLAALHRVSTGDATEDDLKFLDEHVRNPATSPEDRKGYVVAKKLGGYADRETPRPPDPETAAAKPPAPPPEPAPAPEKKPRAKADPEVIKRLGELYDRAATASDEDMAAAKTALEAMTAADVQRAGAAVGMVGKVKAADVLARIADRRGAATRRKLIGRPGAAPRADT